MDKELELFLLQARVKEETIQNLVKDEVGFVAENLLFPSISIRMIENPFSILLLCTSL